MYLDGIPGSAEEALDTQVLLDPFEEEFHLPAALVEGADGQRWKRGVVGKKHQAPAFWVRVAYPSEPFGIGLLGVENHKLDQLVAHQAGASIHLIGIDA